MERLRGRAKALTDLLAVSEFRVLAGGATFAVCEEGCPELAAVGRLMIRVRYTGTFNIVFILE
jgi:hypothetical protein